MRSVRSFFNPTLFRNNVRRCWPLWLGYTLLWGLILPLSTFNRLGEPLSTYGVQELLRDVYNTGYYGGLTMAAIFGIFFAMTQFSYLASARATNGFHALPARRETLFATSWLSGFLCQAATQTAVFLIAALILISHGFAAGCVWTALLSSLCCTLFFYTFGVFCMICTGQILAAPVFYGIFNFLFIALEVLVRSFAGIFLFGYTYDFDSLALLPLSPYANMLANGGATLRYPPTAENGIADAARAELELSGLGIAGIYALVGLAFLVLALLLYRRRQSEQTGNTVAFRWLHPVFKYSVAFCAAVSFGQLVYYICFFRSILTGAGHSLAAVTFCMLLTGLIGYFGAEMLLKKSFRVFRRGWIGAAAVAAVLIVFSVCIANDVTGYERRIPDPDRIESANVIAYGSGYADEITDEETIRLMTRAHAAIVADRDNQRNSSYLTLFEGTPEAPEYVATAEFRYKLRGGGSMVRQYLLTLSENDSGDETTPTGALLALMNSPVLTESRVLGRIASDPTVRITGGCFWIFREPYVYEDDRMLTGEQAEQLYAALRRDAAAGNCALATLNGEETKPGDIEVEFDYRYIDPVWGADNASYNVTVTKKMTETRAVLERIMQKPAD